MPGSKHRPQCFSGTGPRGVCSSALGQASRSRRALLRTPNASPDPEETLAKFNQRVPRMAADGHYVVTCAKAEFANHVQSLRLFSGGGGNRTLLSAIR